MSRMLRRKYQYEASDTPFLTHGGVLRALLYSVKRCLERRVPESVEVDEDWPHKEALAIMRTVERYLDDIYMEHKESEHASVQSSQ